MRTTLLLAFLVAPAGAAPVDFTRDVRPILSQHCFKCHGPDDATRKGGLRLDVRASAIGKAKSGESAIVPGDIGKSELVRRVDAHDAAEKMPPPATKKPLSDSQRAMLKQWIAEGAEYKDHWAFIAPKQAALPHVIATDWAKSPIDRFVLAKLDAAGLKPSPLADKYTLVRRVYLDLIGLPPTLAEADAFVKDPSTNAYETLVDKLLKSPHYGERWARKWLDLARYADTNGYEKDRQRSIWPYRDWVIKALNDDLPFDQFTIQQLAGDLLPGATLEQRIATGFHRNTMLNEEGGADPLEFRWHAVNDRTATTGTVWLGLTLNCCQCHNHKFDPISQKDYFGIFALLNNCDEPTIDVPSAEITAKRAELEKQIAVREAGLAGKFPGDLNAKFDAWLKVERDNAIAWTTLTPSSAKGNVPTLTVEADGSIYVSGDKSKHDVYDLAFRTDRNRITAIRLETLADERLPAGGPGRVNYEGPFGDFFLCEFALTNDGKPIKLKNASADFAEGGNKAPNVIDGNPLTGWSINGGQGRSHQLVVQLAEPLESVGELRLSMLFEKYYAAGLGKFRVSITTDAKPAEARGLPGEIEALVGKTESSASERDRVRTHFLSIAPEVKAERDEIQKLRNTLPKHPTTLVMAERPAHDPRKTFRHKRGEFTQPMDEVKSAVLEALPGLPPGTTADRLAFAKWLVSPTNPLTARVTVNRAWAAFFGRGLVRTTEDFGRQGEPPTHQELLDWLAVDFAKSGWSMKRLHKSIVMSATYRQASRATPDRLERDPKNELLSRGPRFRLEAELLRDNALKISGLLSAKIGGPSVFPPQPPGVTSEGTYGGLNWQPSPGEDRYRRGLYTFSKRTAPYAMFTTFDAPSGEACVARREMSNTPLQALTLLNDAVFLEAAEALGKELVKGSGSDEEKARSLWRRCVTRPPTPDELALVVNFHEAQRTRMKDRPAEAAWTATARALLNLDETVTRE